MKQLPLFPDPNALTVLVYDYGGYYQAEINGGWWVARGATVKEAVRKVIKLYQGEKHNES